MLDSPSAAAIVGLVAAITFGSRIIGALVMTQVGISPRITRFLSGLSVSVLAALVASMLARGGLREAAAVLVAVVVMLATRSAVFAMLAGIACGSFWTMLAG